MREIETKTGESTGVDWEARWAAVLQRIEDGVPAARACREAGLSVNTYHTRYTRKTTSKKRKPADGAGCETLTRNRVGLLPETIPSPDAGGQPAMQNEEPNIEKASTAD